MRKITCEVVNTKGMHARAAAHIVSHVCQFESQVILRHRDKSAPGDSLIKLLTLNAPKGSMIEIQVEGIDEDKVIDDLESLFKKGFGE